MTQRKRAVLSALLIFVMLGALVLTSGAVNVVSLGGTGEVKGRAESATLYFSVEAEGESENAALGDLARRMEEVGKIMQPLGETTETGYHSYSDAASSRVHVGKELIFVTEQPEKVALLFEKLPAVGGVNLHCVSYEAKNTAQAAKEALRLAVEDAKEKAKALGMTKEPDAVRETESYTVEHAGRITVVSRVELLFGEGGERIPHATR